MRIDKIKRIFAKEILDTLRDRRTLMVMIVVPILLYPGILLFINSLATSQQAKMESKTIQVVLLNAPDDANLHREIKKDPKIKIVESKNPIEDVRDGAVHFLVQFPSDWADTVRLRGTATVELHYDRSNDDATTNLTRIQNVISSYERTLLQERLEEKGLAAEYVEPVKMKEVNVASKRRMGGFIIGRFLPMLMVIMILLGSLYPAIDMTAGEKERGTLETILTSPATRTEIVIGKFITVTLISLLTGLLNMASMMATFAYGIFQGMSDAIQIQIPLHLVLVMIVCLIPLAVFFSGIMMALSSFARSFKEAQNLVAPFHIVASLPALVASVPGVRLEGFWLTIPIANVTLLFKELMLGIYNADQILIVLFVNAFLGIAALFFAIELFGREEVLFGEASSLGLAWKRANIRAKQRPNDGEAVFMILISLALVIYVAIPLQARSIISGLIVTELLIFLLFPLALAAYLKVDIRETFRLKLPPARSILLTLLFFVGLMMIVGTVVYIQNQLFPVPKQLADMMEKLMKSVHQFSFPVAVLLIAVMPAVCEEMTFRGFLLSGLTQRWKPLIAILITAVIFGIFHLSLHRFLGVFLIGLAVSYLVWESDSIVPGILLHMMSNGYMAFVFAYPRFDWLGILEMKPSILLTVGGLALIVAALVFRRATVSSRASSVSATG